MSTYISSNDNRLYAALETSFGKVPVSDQASRLPAVKFVPRQRTETATRRDKTGTRSFIGTPSGTRRSTDYQLRTYLTGWDSASGDPGYGHLFQAGMGAAPKHHGGGTIAGSNGGTQLTFQSDHGLQAGQAVATGTDLRFVSAVVDARTVEINAPFSAAPAAGAPALPTLTYKLAATLPSVSIFDFWSPSAAIHRVLCGACVDELSIKVNADFHEFEFRGPARDLIDSASFAEGDGELTSFPDEPDGAGFDYSIVPGHLGQVWLGMSANRFYTLTSAELKISNAIEKRAKEFGVDGLRAVIPGQRAVTLDLELYASDDQQTNDLYAAARQRSAVQAMFQLGQQPQQLFGVFLKSVVPQVPESNDSDTRLSWKFSNCRAQGTDNDEIVIAFA